MSITQAEEPRMLRLYKSTIPSINYIFKNGKPAIFVNGRFATDVESEIAELDKEIKERHPLIFIDSAEVEVSSVKVDPIAAMREQIRAELVAEMAKNTNPANQMGNTITEPLKPASTQDIQQAAAGGSGAALTARINMLKVPK